MEKISESFAWWFLLNKEECMYRNRSDYEETEKSPTWLQKWEFPLVFGGLFLLLIVLFFSLPHIDVVRHQVFEAVRTVWGWIMSLLMHIIVFLVPGVLGIVFRGKIEKFDDILSHQDMNEWMRLALAILISLIVGAIWLLLMPVLVKVPELHRSFIERDWKVVWEIVPWNWGVFAAVSFFVMYLVTLFVQAMSAESNY